MANKFNVRVVRLFEKDEKHFAEVEASRGDQGGPLGRRRFACELPGAVSLKIGQQMKLINGSKGQRLVDR